MKFVFTKGVYLGENTSQAASVRTQCVRAAACIPSKQILCICLEKVPRRGRVVQLCLRSAGGPPPLGFAASNFQLCQSGGLQSTKRVLAALIKV